MKTILIDAVGAFVIKDIGVYQPLFYLLESYDTKKIILTNADDDEKIEFGLVDMPYEIFSLKHAPNKTDPEYFRTMLRTFGLKHDDVVYIEHDPKAVESAQSVGIRSYWYDTEKKDMDALKEFLDFSLTEYY